MSPDDPRHGTNTGYWHGCRMKCCRSAHARYMNLWRMGRSHSDVSSLGTRRRVEALMALGWSRGEVSRRLGHHRDYLIKVISRDWIEPATAAKVAAVYDQLCMSLPPDSPVTAKTRALARRRGYAVPLAWDNIDDPDERPRGIRTDAPVDRIDRIRELDDMHADIAGVCTALGINRDALWKWCDNHGQRDLYQRIARRTRVGGNQWTEGVA